MGIEWIEENRSEIIIEATKFLEVDGAITKVPLDLDLVGQMV